MNTKSGMRRSLILIRVVLGLILSEICLQIAFGFVLGIPADRDVTPTPEPKEFIWPDNPIVFFAPDGTLGFIDPDGSNFTTHPIKGSYTLTDQLTWGADGTFLVTKAIYLYERAPAVITEDGIHFCPDLSKSKATKGYTWGLDRTHVITTITTAAPEAYQIITLNMETCQIENVIFSNLGAIGQFSISGDGWIAYEDYDHAIHVLDDQHREVFSIPNANSPAWSNDSGWLAYIGFPDFEYKGVYIVRRDRTDRQFITDAGYTFSWSPDGEWLVLGDGSDIFTVNIETKRRTLIHRNGEYPSWR